MRQAKRLLLGSLVCGVLVTLPVLAAPSTDDPAIAHMATCQDSWFEWQKSDPAKLKAFADRFHSAFTQKGDDPFFVPKAASSIAGLKVTQVFPGSVGMGVGFSLFVDATFDKARQTLAKALGKPLTKCETSDGMRTCELQVAAQRTVTLMAEDKPGAHQTLIGCYYFYEK